MVICRISTLITFAAALLSVALPSAEAEPISDRITVNVQGKGLDVILIPGLACSNAVWRATVERLSGQYRLHLVQVNGFAGAPARANAAGPLVPPLVQALDAYIKTNQLKSPKIIGHSMGGFMALMLAAQHPEDTSKVMVVDSLPFFGVIMGAHDAAEVAPQAAAMRDQLLSGTPEAFAQGENQMLDMLVKSPEGHKSAFAWAVASDKSVLARALYEVMTTDFRPHMHEIKAPVTLLYPWDAMSGIPAERVDAIYQENFAALPNKKLIRIDGSFHFIMFDQPAAFATQVDAFLK